MLSDYIRRAYLSYGEIATKIAPNFRYVTDDLKKSGLRYTLEEYLSLSIFVSIIILAIEIPIVTLILSFFTHVAIALFLSFIISGIGALFIFFLFTNYPKAQVMSLSSGINKGLPFAVSYMAAAASSDAPPISIFKAIGKLDGYPEMREQAMNVIRDVDALGMDILSALRREAKRTPSAGLKDLFLGIESTIRSGGDLIIYLNSMSESLFNKYQAEIKTYADLLSMLTEIYITVIIIGPIFFAILSSVMAMMGGGEDILLGQAVMSFVIIPVISFAFAFYINISSP
ncbi:MAG: type II secretion system F family protein [Candidatus Aenigmarchaeota archaeon]|nr:type II secretion system F family protein [Candidatus Aenigmarchaeota archaeon]